MLIALALSTTPTMAKPPLMPWRFTSSVETPYGPLPKARLFGFCFSEMIRVGTVTGRESFVKEFRRKPGGPVYSKAVHTTLELQTDATLRGPRTETFELTVTGGYIKGSNYPTPIGSPTLRLGETYLLSVHPMGPPGEGRFFHNWPTGTLIIDGVLQIFPSGKIDEKAATQALEDACDSTDFTTP